MREAWGFCGDADNISVNIALPVGTDTRIAGASAAPGTYGPAWGSVDVPGEFVGAPFTVCSVNTLRP